MTCYEVLVLWDKHSCSKTDVCNQWRSDAYWYMLIAPVTTTWHKVFFSITNQLVSSQRMVELVTPLSDWCVIEMRTRVGQMSPETCIIILYISDDNIKMIQFQFYAQNVFVTWYHHQASNLWLDYTKSAYMDNTWRLS